MAVAAIPLRPLAVEVFPSKALGNLPLAWRRCCALRNRSSGAWIAIEKIDLAHVGPGAIVPLQIGARDMAFPRLNA
jgi:hypothetical protein